MPQLKHLYTHLSGRENIEYNTSYSLLIVRLKLDGVISESVEHTLNILTTLSCKINHYEFRMNGILTQDLHNPHKQHNVTNVSCDEESLKTISEIRAAIYIAPSKSIHLTCI